MKRPLSFLALYRIRDICGQEIVGGHCRAHFLHITSVVSAAHRKQGAHAVCELQGQQASVVPLCLFDDGLSLYNN